MKASCVMIFCLCILLGLNACNMPSAASPLRTSVDAPTATNTPVLSPPSTAAPSPALLATPSPNLSAQPNLIPTFTSTPFTGECLALLAPAEGVIYPADKSIPFTWESMPGATKYLLEITAPDGFLLSIESVTPDYKVSPGMFPGAKQYSWTVVAVDSGEQQICRSQPGHFSISIRKVSPTEKPDKDDGGGLEDGGDDGWW